jgi:hypothetical protein
MLAERLPDVPSLVGKRGVLDISRIWHDDFQSVERKLIGDRALASFPESSDGCAIGQLLDQPCVK